MDEAHDRPIVARTGELDRLASAWTRARGGASRTVIVAGEAGIGKTRLVEAFVDRVAADGRILIGGCVPLGTGDLPYGPFVEALRGLIRATEPGALPALLGSNRAELARLLPEIRPAPVPTRASRPVAAPDPATGGDLAGAETAGRPEPGDDRFAQLRLFEVVLGVLERLSRREPVLLVVEDLQWADSSTLDLLAFLVRNLRDEPILLVTTIRTDELEAHDPVLNRIAELERLGPVDRLDLARLGRDDLARLLQADAGRPVDLAFVDRVWERTGGNPFYAEQMLAAASEPSGSPADEPLPPRLRDIVRARVATVSEAGQAVLRVASAAGARIDDGLLAVVTDLPAADLRDALREVTDRRILEAAGPPDERYLTFRHALLREVIHDDLLPAERAEYHARFARALEARAADRAAGRPAAGPPPSPAELAYHWDAAGDDRRALAATIAAGQAAERAYAWVEAHRHDLRALELRDRVADPAAAGLSDRTELLVRAADTAVLTGAYETALRLGREAIDSVDPTADPMRAGTLRARLRWYLWESGDRVAAGRAAEEAERMIPATPPTAARANVLAHRAAVLMDEGRPTMSLPLAEEALAVAREVGSEGDEALALGILGVDLVLLGQVEDGIARLREATELAEALGSVEGVALGATNLAILLDRVGRTSEGLDVAVAAWERLRVLGVERTYGGLALAVAAKAAIALGRWDEADGYLRSGLDRPSEGTPAIRLWIQRARLDTWRGDVAAADAALEATRSQAATLASSEDRAALLAATAELSTLRGFVADVRRTVDAGFELAGDGLPDPSMAQLAATGLRLEADAAASARSRRDHAAEAVALERAGRIAAAVERVRERLGAPAAAGAGAADSPAPSRATAFAAMCRAEAARVTDGDIAPWWSAVAATWEAINRPYPAAYARYREAAATLRDRGSRDDARTALASARQTAVNLRAEPLLGEIVGLARQARLDLGDAPAATSMRGATARDPAGALDLGLTERELEVLRLIAGGWSNQQIATELFISPKTASVHASNIYDKLGASNRAEAAAIARRLGLVGDPPLPPGSESVA